MNFDQLEHVVFSLASLDSHMCKVTILENLQLNAKS